MVAHGLYWMDRRIRPGGQCVAAVHDWRVLVKVWDQEFTASVSEPGHILFPPPTPCIFLFFSNTLFSRYI